MKDRIKELRLKKGLTQEQFAEQLGVSRTFINLLENGKRDLSDRTIKDICSNFSVNYDWLVYGEGEIFSTVSEIREMITPLLPNNEFAVNLISSMAEMPLEWWKTMEKLAIELKEKTVTKENDPKD